MNPTDELRAALAGFAMLGLLSQPRPVGCSAATAASIALIAVEHADALLEELRIDHSEPTTSYVNQDR